MALFILRTSRLATFVLLSSPKQIQCCLGDRGKHRQASAVGPGYLKDPLELVAKLTHRPSLPLSRCTFSLFPLLPLPTIYHPSNSGSQSACTVRRVVSQGAISGQSRTDAFSWACYETLLGWITWLARDMDLDPRFVRRSTQH